MRSSSSAPVGLLAVIVLVASLAAVIAFVLLRQPAPDVGDGGVRAVTSAATIGETQAATPRADVVAQQPQRSADVAPTSSLAPDCTPLEVRVVDTAGARVTGAVVTWVALHEFPQQGHAPPFWSTTPDELVAFARQHGGAATTGADGVAVVSVERVWRFRVAAAHGDAFGVTMGSLDLVDAGVGCVVVVRPSHTLELEVRDHRDAPADGVAVDLRSADPSVGGSLAIGTTDARGRLTVRHTQELVAHVRQLAEFAPVVLATDILGLDDATFAVDLAAPPRGVQVWKLPPTCAVEFVRADGREGVVAGLDCRAVQRDREGERALDMQELRLRDVTLPYRLARVAAGLRWIVDADERRNSYSVRSDLRGEGRTPAVPADAPVRVVLRPSEEARLTGRIVGVEGRLMRATTVELHGTAEGVRVRLAGGVDDEGRFVVATQTQHDSKTTADTRLVVRTVDQVVAEGALPTFAFPRVGALDLGDVQVLPLPVVVAGRIESRGKGVQNGRVAIEQFAANDGGWKPFGSVSAGEDGSFRAMRASVSGRLRLIATGAGCLPSLPIEFAVGTEGLVVELRRGAMLRAVYVAPEASASEQVVRPNRLPTVRLIRPANGDVAEHVAAEFQVQRSLVDGATVFVAHGSGLLPGTYRLEFSLPFVAAPVHAETVVVPEPTTESESVLVRADLRETLRCVVLRFAVGDGAVPAGEHVVVTAADGSKGSGVVVHGSAFELVVPNAGVDVDVIGPFERERVRVAVREDMTVTFAAVRFAKVVLALDLAEPVPANVRAQVYVSDVRSGRNWRAPLSADGVATVEVPVGGSYETRVDFRVPRGPFSLTPPSGTFTVDAGAVESRVRIELDPKLPSAWK